MRGQAVRVDRVTVTALLSATSEDALFREAVTAARKRLDADRAVVALETDGTLEAASVDGTGDTDEWPHQWEAPQDDRLSTVGGGEARRIDDLADRRRSASATGSNSRVSEQPVQSLLCAPLGDDGVVFAEATAAGAFTGADRAWLEELATFVTAGRSRFRTTDAVADPAMTTVEGGADGGLSLDGLTDRFDFVLEVTASLLWTLDLETDRLRLFGPVESILGAAGRSEWDFTSFVETFVHPDDASRTRQRLEAVGRGETREVEIEFRLHPDESDRERWARARAGLPGDDDTELVGFVTDVTEQVTRERRIKYLQQRTTRLISARSRPRIANIAVNAAGEALTLPLSGIHLRNGDRLEPTAVNERLWEEFGEMPIYHRESDNPFHAFVWETFESGRPAVVEDTSEHERLHEVTQVRSLIAYPLDDYGVFVVAAREPEAFGSVDVALGEVLAMGIIAALERTEQERRLRDQADELERKNERLEEFTSIVSHDLRNPLNVALGRVEYVRSERDDDHLETAEQALERMESIIEETLVLARQGHEVTDRNPISVPKMVEQCWQNVQTNAATLTLEFDGDYVVAADRERLAHVLENLFTNAVEHGSTVPGSHAPDDAGGNSVSDEPSVADAPVDASDHAGDAVTIRVGPLPDGNGFYVEDDGQGIPAPDRDAVFEAGYTTAEDGTGFGLSLVRDIVEAHGWTVRVTDGSDGGARFEIDGTQ